MSDSKTWDAKRVRSLRLRLSLTQEQFAYKLGVSFVSVSRWENGGKISGLSQKALDALAAKGKP